MATVFAFHTGKAFAILLENPTTLRWTITSASGDADH